jgi:RimJ/RimL family protein N-acetyltransferase
LYLLSPTQYSRVRSILQTLDIHLVINAILTSRTEGQVYVDDPDQPQVALAQHHHRFYLAMQDPAAGAGLLTYWSEVLYPQAQAAGHEMYVLYAASDAWAPLIEETLASRGPIPAPRQYWAISTQEQREIPPLPDGYRITAVDEVVRHETGLAHLDELIKEIESEHASLEAFRKESFGVCALYQEREIAGWCLAEYGNTERCEVGIETQPEHRRRGLGTAMTVALVAQARARGLSQIGWHSYTRNVPSVRTARKAGLHKVCDHPAYIGHFDPIVHLSDRGYNAIGQGRLEEGLAWLQSAFAQTAFAQGAAPGWAYYTAGCACAALDRHDEAFRYLDQAIEHGFAERTLYETDDRLRALQGTPKWQALIARVADAHL